jgi:hypothetical protein
MAAELFVITAGVRRAKLYQLAGRANIRAQVFAHGGKLVEVRDVPIEDLRSGKSVIDLTTNVSQKLRFLQLENAVVRGVQLSPIEVERGSQGIPIRDVIAIR